MYVANLASTAAVHCQSYCGPSHSDTVYNPNITEDILDAC